MGCDNAVKQEVQTAPSEDVVIPKQEISKQGIAKKNIASQAYIEGVHYEEVDGIHIPADIKEPFILQYFWFGCGHCQNFEPVIQRYLAQEQDVSLLRKPAAFSKRWLMDAKIFYALKSIGEMQYFDDLFDLYRQKHKDKQLPNKSEIEQLLQSKNIDVEAFFKATESSVQMKKIIRNINEMTKNKISGVPTVIVNGRYRVLAHDDTKKGSDYFNLLNFLKSKG